MRTARHLGSQRANPEYQLARLSSTVLSALFLIGVTEGAVKYSDRSPVIARHVAGTNAVTFHVILAGAAAGALIGIQARRSHRTAHRGLAPWAAPFSARALARLGLTIRFADGLSIPNLARATATVPLALLLAYQPLRMGEQLTGGVDPNATVNAWGGPTYAGALLAHWLDCLVGFYLVAFLLNLLLLPDPVGNR